MPVWTGVSTPWRVMTPGAMRSTGRWTLRDGALIVERTAERVHDATEQGRADRYFSDPAGGLDRVAFP